jgi:hypothetical protein
MRLPPLFLCDFAFAARRVDPRDGAGMGRLRPLYEAGKKN